MIQIIGRRRGTSCLSTSSSSDFSSVRLELIRARRRFSMIGLEFCKKKQHMNSNIVLALNYCLSSSQSLIYTYLVIILIIYLSLFVCVLIFVFLCVRSDYLYLSVMTLAIKFVNVYSSESKVFQIDGPFWSQRALWTTMDCRRNPLSRDFAASTVRRWSKLHVSHGQ